MTYVIPLIVVLVLVAGFVTFLVLNATRRGRSASSGGEQGPPGIGQDETPLGDTAEHAGTQADSGRTVGRADAGEAGGTGEPVHSGYEGTSAAGAGPGATGDGAHRRRSGEGEGTEAIDFPDVRPEGVSAGGAATTSRADAAGGGDEAQAAEQRDEPAAEEGGAELSPEDAERDRLRQLADEEGERPRPASERLADREF